MASMEKLAIASTGPVAGWAISAVTPVMTSVTRKYMSSGISFEGCFYITSSWRSWGSSALERERYKKKI